jgi:hypothetical protein
MLEEKFGMKLNSFKEILNVRTKALYKEIEHFCRNEQTADHSGRLVQS